MCCFNFVLFSFLSPTVCRTRCEIPRCGQASPMTRAKIWSQNHTAGGKPRSGASSPAPAPSARREVCWMLCKLLPLTLLPIRQSGGGEAWPAWCTSLGQAALMGLTGTASDAQSNAWQKSKILHQSSRLYQIKWVPPCGGENDDDWESLLSCTLCKHFLPWEVSEH